MEGTFELTAVALQEKRKKPRKKNRIKRKKNRIKRKKRTSWNRGLHG